VDEIAIFGRDEERHSVKMFLAHYDVPAYVRRARQVEEALEQLLAHCRQKREELLTMVRMRIGVLQAMGSDWGIFRPWLKEEQQVTVLRDLHRILQPEPRVPLEPCSSMRAVRRALQELCESIQNFNHRWRAFLQTVDLTVVNELRAGYNRYYLLEKECALRSPRLARQGFRRLEPLTRDDLALLLPPLPVPTLAA
jgi:hypothetical protein